MSNVAMENHEGYFYVLRSLNGGFPVLCLITREQWQMIAFQLVFLHVYHIHTLQSAWAEVPWSLVHRAPLRRSDRWLAPARERERAMGFVNLRVL
jgi:hypothetical protein